MKFYSPKNFKKGRHIGGLFRMIDVLLLAAGSAIFIPMILFILTRDDINFILLLIMAIFVWLYHFIDTAISSHLP